MNAEVVARLLHSLDVDESQALGGRTQAPQLSDLETELLVVFRGMPEEKRKALISLLR